MSAWVPLAPPAEEVEGILVNDAPRLLRGARCEWENHRRYGAVGRECAFSQLPLLEGSSIVWCGVADRNRFPYYLWRCDYYRDTTGG